MNAKNIQVPRNNPKYAGYKQTKRKPALLKKEIKKKGARK
jgi:hypothetical protein